jgi:hypothetical protein
MRLPGDQRLSREEDLLRRHSRLRLRGGKLRREPRKSDTDWIPAFTGMTDKLLHPLVYFAFWS